MPRILKYIISGLFILPHLPADAQLSFSEMRHSPISITPEASTGLDALYVIYDTSGITASFTSSASKVTVMRYSNLGGGYAQEISDLSKAGTSYSFPLSADDEGYIIDEDSRRHYYWICNYANHYPDLRGLTPSPESDCVATALEIEGSAPRILFYTIHGQAKELSRDLKVVYHTLEINQEAMTVSQIEATETLASAEGTVRVPAPLCDTEFSISGDRFLLQWGEGQEAVSPTVPAIAVECATKAEQTYREASNENKNESDGLGGSAPADITFTAVVSDACIFHEWQMSTYPEFDIIDLRYSELEIEHTFREQGSFYVRFVGADASGDCTWESEPYQVSIGDSRLECPNAFSPGASEGINDEWKVSYRSIVDFECHIFNRWGVEITKFTDPALGWDGKYKGKIVDSGVYFYVIEATGADGKKYNISGDINVINSKRNYSSSGSE